MTKITADIIENRIHKGWEKYPEPRPYIKMDKALFARVKDIMTFTDSEFGDWLASPDGVMRGGMHPKRKSRYLSPQEIQKRITEGYEDVPPRPFIKLKAETYINQTTDAIFVDSEYGEWAAYPARVLSGSCHARRIWDAKIPSAEDVQERITNGTTEIPPRPFIKLKTSTYIKTSSRATFIDSDYGEWEALVQEVLSGTCHPYRNKKYTAAEVEAKIQKDRPFIKLDHSSFVNISEKARFIDDEYGEWWAKGK